jgi:hypothetical protein
MANEVKSVLGKWVPRYQWHEFVMGTTWKSPGRGIQSMWRIGFMAHSVRNDIGFRLVRGVEEKCRQKG